MISVSITMLFMVHLIACLFFMIAKLNNFTPTTWVYRFSLVDKDQITQYLFAVDWALQTLTTVGYGDINARQQDERVLALLWMIAGVGFYSFTIGNLASIIRAVDFRAARLQDKLTIISEFVRRSNLPQEVEMRIRRFIENNHIEHLQQGD